MSSSGGSGSATAAPGVAVLDCLFVEFVPRVAVAASTWSALRNSEGRASAHADGRGQDRPSVAML